LGRRQHISPFYSQFVEGSLSRKEASVASPVGISVNASSLTPLSVDDGHDSGASSEWLDEDQPEKTPTTTAFQPKPNHLVLRPRRFTPTSRRLVGDSAPKSGGIRERTVGDGADNMSPRSQSMDPSWSSQKSPVRRRGAELSPGVKKQTNDSRNRSSSLEAIFSAPTSI